VSAGVTLPALSAPGLAANERRVEFWGVSSPAHEAAVKKTAEEIKSRTGLTINYVRSPAGWQNQLERLNAALAGGNVPDIVHVKDLNMWDYAWREQAIPLDDYFAKSRIDPSRFRKSVWNAMHYRGKVYGAPWKGSFVWLQFINHDLFKAAGLNPETDAPATWDKLVEIGGKLTNESAGQYGHTFYALGTTEPAFFLFTALVGQAGGTVLSNGQLALDTPEATEALQWMHDMLWKHKISVPPDQMQNVWNIVKSGRVGTWQNGLWFVDEALATAPQLKWSIHPIPSHKTADNVDTPECIMIPKGAKNPDLSFEAIELLLDPKIDLEHALVQGFLPAYEDNLNQLGGAATQHPEIYKAYAEIGRNPALRARQWTEGYDEMVTAVMPEIQAVWFDQASVRDGLAQAQEAGSKVLTRVKETGR
jgi:ABC-type glycerol-3-phosphate transport system substrate-binding protein